MYLVSVELLARGGSGTQGKISDTAKRKQLVGFIVIMVIGTFGGDVVLVVMTTAREVSRSAEVRSRFVAHANFQNFRCGMMEIECMHCAHVTPG